MLLGSHSDADPVVLGGCVPTVPRRRGPPPRHVSNDVGADIGGKATVLEWDAYIPVWVTVYWDDEPPMELPGFCFAYTRTCAGVSITDPETSYRYSAWVRASDVRRREVTDGRA